MPMLGAIENIKAVTLDIIEQKSSPIQQIEALTNCTTFFKENNIAVNHFLKKLNEELHNFNGNMGDDLSYLIFEVLTECIHNYSNNPIQLTSPNTSGNNLRKYFNENDELSFAYTVVKRWLDGNIERKDAKEILENNGWKPMTANLVFKVLKDLVNGLPFTMVSNSINDIEIIEILIKGIMKDYGRVGLSNALTSLKKTIKVLTNKRKATWRMEELWQKYNKLL